MNDFKLTSTEIEIAVAQYVNPRVNLIVPNVSWGMFRHECDLLVVTKAGYAWEIEIKISRADLLRDKKKWHNHRDHRIKDLYFAMPSYMEKDIDLVPERAGILMVGEFGRCKKLRNPAPCKKPYKFSDNERFQIARLGSLRIWGLKRKLVSN